VSQSKLIQLHDINPGNKKWLQLDCQNPGCTTPETQQRCFYM